MEKVKRSKPTSPGSRGRVYVANDALHKGRPHKSLVSILPKHSGRNNSGRITTRHQGGRHKRLYRIIDWKRDKSGVPAKVERIEYDPNRTANIALLSYRDGEFRYIIAPKDLKAGDIVESGLTAPISVGNALPLSNIPLGTIVHCVEMKKGKGAQLARSAGAGVQLLAREGKYATIRLRSGEMRKVPADCTATIGEVSNSEHGLKKLGKAGRKRHMGIRPTVRGVAMNPVDHPLGGGEGRSSGGRPPCSPWGVPEGTKTRRNKLTGKLIVRRRKSSRDRRK